jgi:hypothetical protein
VVHVAVKASQDFKCIRNYDYDKSPFKADPYSLNCLSFFTARVDKIRCSSLSRLSAINKHYRQRVVCFWGFSAAWIYRVSSEKLKVNDELVDVELLEEESAEMHMCGE